MHTLILLMNINACQASSPLAFKNLLKTFLLSLSLSEYYSTALGLWTELCGCFFLYLSSYWHWVLKRCYKILKWLMQYWCNYGIETHKDPLFYNIKIFLTFVLLIWNLHCINMYAFGRCFYPKLLKWHSRYCIFWKICKI